jgi:tetratricopeptide (TPR) repeat protein
MRRGLLLAVLALAACASQADLNVLYKRGLREARKDDFEHAMKDLDQFTGLTCGGARPDRRCREAYLALGHCRESAGAPASAWAAFDRAIALPPHEKDPAVKEDLARAEEEVADKLKQQADHGPVLIRYRDEVPEEYSLHSVTISIDFQPVVTRDKNAGELHSADFTQVYAGPLTAGQHVLVLDAVHNCKAGQEAPCARSELHRAWSFESEGHAPTTIELRGYADPGEDGRPAQPTAALTKR